MTSVCPIQIEQIVPRRVPPICPLDLVAPTLGDPPPGHPPYVFGLAEPPLSESLSGDVRVPSPHVESAHQFVDGLGDHLPPPQPQK